MSAEPLKNTKNENLAEAARKIRLIVCDMDGTLLGRDRLISERNLSAIRAAREKGVRTTVCSGRIFPMMESYIRTLQLDCPLISSNGAVVSEPDGTLLRHTSLAPADCYSLLTYALNHQLDISVLSDESCWFSSNSLRINRFIEYNAIASRSGMRQIELHMFPASSGPLTEDVVRNTCPELEKLHLRKILIYELAPGQPDAVRHVIDGLPGLYVTSSEKGLFDILPAGTDKGTGLIQLAEALGLKPDEVMVFGDYDNDKPMFAWAGIGIAMGNSVPALKSIASAVTAANDKDGVALAIEAYILH